MIGQFEHSEKQTTFNKYSPFSQVPYWEKYLQVIPYVILEFSTYYRSRRGNPKYSGSLAGTLDIEGPHLGDKKVETRYVIESNSGI